MCEHFVFGKNGIAVLLVEINPFYFIYFKIMIFLIS